MLVLGLTTEDDSGAAVVRDGQILSAVNEERLSRIKLVEGFPRASINEVMRLAEIDTEQIDAVVVAAKRSKYMNELAPSNGWLDVNGNGFSSSIKKLGGRFAAYRDKFPPLEDAYYALLQPTFVRRRRAISHVIRSEYGFQCPIYFVDHHLAHIASAYFTSGYEDALVISLDGGGDGKSSTVYKVRDGQFDQLHEVSAYDSLGNYYAYATILCGFKAHRHEGKVTGLAAHGEGRYIDLLQEFIDEEGGTLQNKGGVVFSPAVVALRDALPTDYRREDLAASIQRHSEQIVRRYVQHWVRHSHMQNIALAGGVFANVRINQEIHEIPELNNVFVHPHMVDGGLATGAALAACIPGITRQTMQRESDSLADVYLGPGFSDSEIANTLAEHGVTPGKLDRPIEDRVAELLAEGYTVARVNGRMEYGPRVLGNRSILYQPGDRSVNDWLNLNLKRTEFMPFAPSVLYEDRHTCFEDVDGAEHAAEFMTITFQCKPWMREAMSGVVHLDGTARPHLVRKDRNPGFHRIIESFKEITGLPAVINTSFNMHEEPIVCTADDSVRAFLAAKIDYLAIGPYLIQHPSPMERELTPVRKRIPVQ